MTGEISPSAIKTAKIFRIVGPLIFRNFAARQTGHANAETSAIVVIAPLAISPSTLASAA